MLAQKVGKHRGASGMFQKVGKRDVVGEKGCKSGSQMVQKVCKRDVVGEKDCKSGSQRVSNYRVEYIRVI